MAGRKVVILNKAFLGDWLNNDANIGHEIIDFVKADNGKLYVYNTPYGSCPDNIQCPNDEGQTNEKDIAEYMVLTGRTKKTKSAASSFDVLYVIELKKKLNRRKDVDAIKYGEVALKDIYEDTKDTSLFATFEAGQMYEAIRPIPVALSNYNFQSNKGYVYSDEKDYKKLDIAGWLKKGLLQKAKLIKVKKKKFSDTKTFLDLIHMSDNEQVFTNIMHSILSHGNLLQEFISKFSDKKIDIKSPKVEREKSVPGGRCDIYATSDNCTIIIENKVFSGLNGIKDDITQLSTYYKVAQKDTNKKIICFVTAPSSRKLEIQAEIKAKDKKICEKYKIITYGEMAEFIEKHKKDLKNWSYNKLIDDIIKAFENLSKPTKLDIYAQKFHDKIQMIKNNK